MKLGSVDTNRDVFVIAEIGNNHEGDPELAKKLVIAAARCGVDAVKFQSIIPEELVSIQDENRFGQLRKFQLSRADYLNLKQLAESEGVQFLTTPFDLRSIDEINDWVSAYKIASGDNVFFPLIEKIAHTGKPIILSGGICTLDELTYIRDFIYGIWTSKGIRQELAVLHCVVSYPVPDEEANIGALRDLHGLGTVVGYSDHTLGIEACRVAVSCGARIIEKHFTLDKQFSSFRDHQLSADPEEMAELVKSIRKINKLLGHGKKEPMPSEREMIEKVRRSIVANSSLEKGTTLRLEDLSWVRPAGGLKPGDEELIVGKTLARNLKKGDRILLEDVIEKVST